MVIATTTALAVAGVGLSAASAYSGAKSSKAQAKFNQAQAQRNAEIARRNAEDVTERGYDQIADQKKTVIRSLSQVRAGAAGAGLTVGEEGTTPQELVTAMAQAGEIDIMRLRENIDRERQRAVDQGANFSAQAVQAGKTAKSINPFRSAVVGGFQSAVGSSDILFPS